MNDSTDIRTTLQSYSKEQLIDMLISNGIDQTFGITTRNYAVLFNSSIDSGKTMIVLDIANMHAANHSAIMGYMDGVDQHIRSVLDAVRHSDTLIRWGSDEIVIILNSGNAVDYIDRFHRNMADNMLYGVYSIVTTSNNLEESVNRAIALNMDAKSQLERHGLKPDRNMPYEVLASVVVSE